MIRFHTIGLKDDQIKIVSAPYESQMLEEVEKLAGQGYQARLVTTEDHLLQYSGPELVRIFNYMADGKRKVKEFHDKKSGAKRVFAMLCAPGVKDRDADPEAPSPAPETEPAAPAATTEAPAAETATPNQEEPNMATATAKKKTKTERKTRADAGKPAKKVADFKPFRDGTNRAAVLRLMNGHKTTAEIAAEIKMVPAMVNANFYCLWRDCGIGYEFDDKGRVTALYPTGRTIKDAIIKAKE